jgi:hypothetical protein
MGNTLMKQNTMTDRVSKVFAGVQPLGEGSHRRPFGPSRRFPKMNTIARRCIKWLKLYSFMGICLFDEWGNLQLTYLTHLTYLTQLNWPPWSPKTKKMETKIFFIEFSDIMCYNMYNVLDLECCI